ncbi:GTPase HflX [Alkalibaculum sp. M08DMB]|uniref:GTPase HflX n=1 Tax=Alkalibaculum sporogenes TaxID=2655001 RepID=A0A6A7KBZ6_9FIRM|nr:GTPase HflX [Alkalibaculum sporogenes]MPW27060.1 GTPase HflX [Alkalibaculum sporogenes]
MINGNIDGIKKTILDTLENLIDYRIPKDKILDEFVVYTLLEVTDAINKEVLIVIDNSNTVVAVGVGDHKAATFPDISKRIKKRGLNGLMSFHTHPNGNPKLSSADMSSLLDIKFNLIGAIGKNSIKEPLINLGIINNDEGNLVVNEYGPFSINKLNQFHYSELVESVDSFLRSKIHVDTLEEEKAILVGVNTKSESILDIENSMEELRELTYTAGATPIDKLVQNKERIDNNFYIGKGKLEELRIMIQNNSCNLVICNDELTSIQLKVMETYLNVKIIDRTSLILDIFAKHAKTSEGKLQVELAQLKYRLPRLLGLGKVLSRTGGGIGTRGPGEKKLETDRRTIYKEIHILENKIKSMKNVRQQQKSRRIKNHIPVVSLVGYTNAGKSTLFNLLTASNVLSENKLFATLDATTRKFKNLDRELLLSDTVGFIDKLPHDLIKSFESTLEGLVDSDMLLHVIDSSNKNFLKQIQLVEEVLHSLKCSDKKIIYVFNKIDKMCDDFDSQASTIRGIKSMISAKQEIGVQELSKLIHKEIFGETIIREIKVPYFDTKYISSLHDLGIVLEEKYEEDGIIIKIQYTSEVEYLVQRYIQ